MTTWQPIETAPLDGTIVDLWIDVEGDDKGRCVDCSYRHSYRHGKLGWYSIDANECLSPTHWMPTPKAPKISRTQILDQRCKHMHFAVKAKVNRLVGMEVVDTDKIDVATSRVTGHTLNLSVLCKDCGLPFRFIGLQSGSSVHKPRVSIDATELRAPLEPSYVPEILGTPIVSGRA